MSTLDNDRAEQDAAVSELERRLQEMRDGLEETRKKMGELDAEIRRLKDRNGSA